LVPGGLLSASSCSHHLSASELERLLLDDARKLGREIALLERGGQGPDHPIHLAIPETAYLKSALVRVS
jgi:23S rRNA (cytosine1962-C5)-methyltransferase